MRHHRSANGEPPDGAFVFAASPGRPYLHTGAPRSSWRRLTTAATLAPPQPTPHALRHAYASLLLASGKTAHKVAQLLGHADAGLVDRRYGHALPDRIRTAGDDLERFLKTARGPQVDHVA
jgi:integrase